MATPQPAKKTAYPADKLDVINRRIKGGRTPAMGSTIPRLKGQAEPMEVAFINTDMPNRFGYVTEELGWEGVTPDEVLGRLPQGDVRADEGRVVRGERGQEILVKIPKRLIDQARMAEADRMDRAMRSKTKFSSIVRERVAADGQERVAERMHDVEVDTLNVGTERVAYDPTPLDKATE